MILKTGKIHERLTDHCGLLFGGDLGGNIVAYDAAQAKPLWHSHIGKVSNAPETQ